MKNKILMKISEHAKTDTAAINYCGKEMLYGELDRQSNNIANQIRQKLNGKQHVPIIIYEDRGIQFILTIVAVLKCNCYYIPIEKSIPIDRVRYIEKNSGASMVLTDSLNTGKTFDCTEYCMNYDPKVSDQFELLDMEESDIIYVIYTSGTSGNPKGVIIMYSNLINLMESFNVILYHKFHNPINVGLISSFSFDSSVKQVFGALFYGHKLCIADSKVKMFGRKMHEFHLKYNLTVCDMTPSHLKLSVLQKTNKITKIPYLIIGGEILYWETLKSYVDFIGYTPTFINVYGPTECCVDVSYNYIDKHELEKHETGQVPVGISLLNTKLIIRDSENNEITEKNRCGELCVQGKQVGAGYVNLESSNFTFVNGEKEYRTGDVAYLNDDSRYVVTGRKDKQVKINGNRVELEEISSLVEHFLNVPCVVLYSIINENSAIIAYIVSNHISDEKQTSLKQYLISKLPSYMIPRYYIYGNSYPLTCNGKIDEAKIVQSFMIQKEK